jgi:VanZ family protein
MRAPMFKNAVRWFSFACALAVMAAIFWFSSKSGEASGLQSQSFTERVMAAFLPYFNRLGETERAELVGRYSPLLRVAAHFGLFSLLGLFCGAFSLTLKGKKAALSLYAFSFCLLYALSDEVHQIFVEGRAFELSDLGVDALGALAGICAALLSYYIYRGKKKRLT